MDAGITHKLNYHEYNMRVSATLLFSLAGLASTTTALHVPDFLWSIIDKIDRRCQYDCWCAEDDLSAQCCASTDGTFDDNPTPTCVKMNLTGATTFATCCGSKNGYGCSQKTRCPRPDGGNSYVDRGPHWRCTVMKYDIAMPETAVVGNGGESLPVRELV